MVDKITNFYLVRATYCWSQGGQSGITPKNSRSAALDRFVLTRLLACMREVSMGRLFLLLLPAAAAAVKSYVPGSVNNCSLSRRKTTMYRLATSITCKNEVLV